MKLEEITQKDFQRLSEKDDAYFQNGVIFSSVTNNVVAFMEDMDFMNYESPFKYYEVKRNDTKND